MLGPTYQRQFFQRSCNEKTHWYLLFVVPILWYLKAFMLTASHGIVSG
jgi:hypothetical protein